MTEIKNRIIGSGVEPLDQILFNPRNWRVHPLNQQNALKGVLEEVGWVQEVIVNQRTGHLVDGHLRCQLAAREGAKTIPVKYVDLSEEEEALVLSTLDPIAAMATTDKQKLDELFASIETENADVLKMLDDIAEKERLEYAKRDPVDAEPQIDRAAELNEKWQVVTGDLWQIGEHRLLCGDSTKREDVERVMAGEKAGVMISDPPYNVGYEYEGAVDDNKQREDYAEFCRRYLSIGSLVSEMQVITPGKANERLYAPAEWMTWYKGFGLSRGHYFKAMVTEPILLFGAKPTGKFYATDHFDVPTDREPGLRELHSCPKPVALFEALISPMTEIGDFVYEAFAGSGTTMVACQNLNRKCRAIEISPNYCAVILERMSTAFPGLEIKKVY